MKATFMFPNYLAAEPVNSLSYLISLSYEYGTRRGRFVSTSGRLFGGRLLNARGLYQVWNANERGLNARFLWQMGGEGP
jgi:hypothetical protein